mmetsp:Transcript_13047/g.19919  ORF Transcript_13047/g.19919 Transcript_13047/m.19919 type:complete len:357 (-) Transcript_13047:103-1173(-)|eukprot:CAMPEP_0178907154 /NCGR_PEP_ID=MMETSP0786-20121207/7213_1 /TAXON_ID=186022 /ORGANISM="Thalassionema frauenfeldii, Strain CCMP 1798" /LENGTH=356 /DNA_ID=CAMNT_0020578921 /DNA_START=44 /DNA_END=1114 /DNA_ORIENTATION=-
MQDTPFSFMMNQTPEYDTFCNMDSIRQFNDDFNDKKDLFADEMGMNGNNGNSSSSLVGVEELLSDEMDKPQKRKRKTPKIRWKKPADMPKRPLSAYNYFFKHERERLMEEGISSGEIDENATNKSCGIGFTSLAKQIAAKWKTLDDQTKIVFQNEAMEDKKRYQKEVEIWKSKQQTGRTDIEKVSHIEPADLLLRNSAPSSMLPKKPAASLRQPALPMPALNASTSMPISLLGSSSSLKRGRASLDDFDVPIPDDTGSVLISPPPTGFPRRTQSDSFVPPPNFSRRSQSDSFLLPVLSDNYRLRSCEELAAESNHIGVGFGAADTSMRALVEGLDPDSVNFISELRNDGFDDLLEE